MVLKFKCEYDGMNYCGFQRQKNGLSVQQVLEETLTEIFSEKITLHASGRTDAGVHARSQVCSFKISLKSNFDDIELFNLARRVNSMLPPPIAVRDFEVAEDGFNARYAVVAKTYVYRCYVSKFRSPLRDSYMLQIYEMPNVDAMRDAAKMLIGKHDFTSFCNVQTDKEDKVRTIHELEIKYDGDEIIFKICGNGFLRNMVRIIVGTLLDVGNGKILVSDVDKILKSKDRNMAGKTVDAKGLILWEVEY